MTSDDDRPPQGEWERSAGVARFDEGELEAMLRPAIGPCRVTRAEVLSGGLCNTNVLVELAGRPGPLVIRAYAREPDACAREIDVLKHVRARLAADELPFPDVIYADCSAETTGRPHAVMQWCPGKQLASVLPSASAEDLAAFGAIAGRVAALLSHIKLPWCGELGPGLELAEDWGTPRAVTESHVHECLFQGRAGPRLGLPMRDRLWRYVEAHAPALDVLEGDYSLLHGDFKAENILVAHRSGRWELAAVLDWELACAGPALADLGTLLRHRSLTDDPMSSAAANAFVQHGGRLPENWRELARLLDINGLCTFLNQSEERPRVFADARALLERTLGTDE